MTKAPKDMIDATDIKQLCSVIGRFSQKAGLRWDGSPVITWEFVTIDEFMRCRFVLLNAIRAADLMPQLSRLQPKPVNGDTEEIDCMGVTFRLVCKARMMTPRGPLSGPQIS